MEKPSRIRAPQLAEMIKVVKKLVTDGKTAEGLDVAAFEKECGVGQLVSREELEKAILALLDELKLREVCFPPPFPSPFLSRLISTQDGKVKSDEVKKSIGAIWKGLKTRLPWHEPPAAKIVLDSLMENKKEDHTRRQFEEPEAGWGPAENVQKDAKLLEGHLKATGGRVITRFPPEPNGYLHIGHAKAMQLDFGYAKAKGGECIMRFDDTNPEVEKPEYVQAILADVAWMGHKQSRITYASDYFQELYDFAVQLIKKDLAYVDHQTPAEMEEYRAQHKVLPPSPSPSFPSILLSYLRRTPPGATAPSRRASASSRT